MSQVELLDNVSSLAPPSSETTSTAATTNSSTENNDGSVDAADRQKPQQHQDQPQQQNIDHQPNDNDIGDDDDDEDLEDGEIDDDDDDGDDDVIVVANSSDDLAKAKAKQSSIIAATANDDSVILVSEERPESISHKVSAIDLTSSPTSSSPVPKSKKPRPLEEDYAGNIANAIASALKKKGIEPALPRIADRVSADGQDTSGLGPGPGQGQSRSSRRRKRKKQREEKEKEKDRKDKKRRRYDSDDELMPPSKVQATAASGGDDDDDFEMLNVRGGSPPPYQPSAVSLHDAYKGGYDSVDYSGGSSYDSYDSMGEGGGGGGGDAANRRRRRAKKDTRKRRDRGRDGKDKRSRKDSPEDKHRNEPRKLELCKFYLMECCAKKDKCSYMHSDFPCKYYYLGMECVHKETCKFAHGEPLSEQLRNILLKHLETAPKEILGEFKRISREHAIEKITKRHDELCKKFGKENNWSAIPLLPINPNRRGAGGGGGGGVGTSSVSNSGGGGGSSGGCGDHQPHQHQHQHQHQQPNRPPVQTSTAHPNIPSLLDMVINPPPSLTLKNDNNKRKSRWLTDGSGNNNRQNVQPPSIGAPSHLDLQNLSGIISDEHIEKLSSLGIVNLEQVNQLTVGQLNQIGLTIAEIGEIQLKAANMDKTTTASTASTPAEKDPSDGVTAPPTETNDKDKSPAAAATVEAVASLALDRDADTGSNSNSNCSINNLTVDYSQYLKDSNVNFDRSDMYDDERDDEQLIIDDENMESEEKMSAAAGLNSDDGITAEEKKSDDFDIDFSRLPPLPNEINSSVFTTLYGKSEEEHGADETQASNRRDPRSRNAIKIEPNESKDNDSDDERYYQSRGRRSRSNTPTHSGSSTPDASQSPDGNDEPQGPVKYSRKTIYDFTTEQAEEDEADRLKGDKDMRYLGGIGGDIGLMLPFRPVMNYTPATEVDGSITSHLPMAYKVYEVDVPPPSYSQQRTSFKSDHTTDPRLRRILGMPELSPTKSMAMLGASHSGRKHSISIASPESDEASPKYYTPPSTESERAASISKTSTSGPLRADPRRAAAAAAAAASTTSNKLSSMGSSTASSSSAPAPSASTAAKQNIEMRNLLQKSDWYKNLNSKFKIMVNQQLALVSTELKKFHQDPSPNKIFDMSFIFNNATLQQILTNLGIYIDDNGEVAHIDGDGDDSGANNGYGGVSSAGGGITLPNLSQPPPSQQLDFLRGPPPNMVVPPLLGAGNASGPGGPGGIGPPSAGAGMFRPGLNGPPPPINMGAFGPPPNVRPSLLGLPPGSNANPFNPFAGSNMPDVIGGGGGGGGGPVGGGVGPAGGNLNFVGGPNVGAGLLGPGPMAPFGNFGPANMQHPQQRNFGGGHNQPRRNQNRRNNNYGGGGGGNSGSKKI